MTTPPVDWENLFLAKGSHSCDDEAMCLWEAISLDRIAEKTDACPEDVSKLLHAFTISLNDTFPDDQRQKLKAYRDRFPGTANQPGADQRAGWLCADWLIRTYTPAWLRLAGLTSEADALAGAPEITDLVTLGAVTGHVTTAKKNAAAAWDAARDAAGDAAWAAAWDALSPTVAMLQDSAFDLLDRMLDGYQTVGA
jgi:hypothetical protein